MIVNIAQRKGAVSVIFFIICIFVLIFGGWFLVQGFLKKAAPTPQKARVQSSQPLSEPIENGQSVIPLAIRDGALLVEVAKTESELARGLSGRPFLSLDRGMLFDLGEERTPSFWMKDMSFSLDFIWINDAFMVTDITKNVSPESFPTMFSPDNPVRYVLEVNAGFAEKFGISVGDRVITPTLDKE